MPCIKGGFFFHNCIEIVFPTLIVILLSVFLSYLFFNHTSFEFFVIPVFGILSFLEVFVIVVSDILLLPYVSVDFLLL